MSDVVTLPREVVVWARFAVENILLRKPIDRAHWLKIDRTLDDALRASRPEDTPLTKKEGT